MGIKKFIKKAASKGADAVAKCAVLSPEQLRVMEEQRARYIDLMPMNDEEAVRLYTEKYLSTIGIEIYQEYLHHLKDLYIPVETGAEYENEFEPGYNIRWFKITKWVTDKKENSLEKLVNVYEVLSNENCNIALVFHRTMIGTDVYLAVMNTDNASSNTKVDELCTRLESALKGNFPGSQFEGRQKGTLPCLNNSYPYSVATVSNIPGEKSEKFISQTIEKLLDGIEPDDSEKDYTLILMATPVKDVEDRKLHLAEMYSALYPYSGWQTDYHFNQSDSTNSSATFGVNAGVSAGLQRGANQTVTNSDSTSDSSSQSVQDSESHSNQTSQSSTETTGNSTSKSHTDSTAKSRGTSESKSSSKQHAESASESKSNTIEGGVNASVGKVVNAGLSTSHSETNGTSVSDAFTNGESHSVTDGIVKTISDGVTKQVSESVAKSVSAATTKSVGTAITNTLGKAVTKTVAVADGVSKGVNAGANFGANFARSSNVMATVGSNEGITQSFTNYTIKHTLQILEKEMQRYDQCTALGMWDFAAYVLSEDDTTANNVAHSYLALTQGEKSYMAHTAVNLWRGNSSDAVEKKKSNEITAYLRELRHPLFSLNPDVVVQDLDTFEYPGVVTAATALSGKELAYSLNFPQKSVSGLPVLECVPFGRNIVTYDATSKGTQLEIGQIFHMNHPESVRVSLNKNSLASHTFITGSTGSGKSNTVYKLLGEAVEQGTKFLVVEPAKGEYKHVFGMDNDVCVYGTNAGISPLLRLNPFSFPENIHVFEHLDRLVEIFNVCWPMYAAMPAVLKHAIEKSYEDCGWDLVKSYNPYGRDLYPDFADVARNIKEIIDSSEYDAENKGAYKGSLLTRLQSLSSGVYSTIFVSDELRSEELFDQNVIIDLSRVGSSETKSLIMGMLVLKLQEYRMSSATAMNAELKHITVLEEAHNILKRTSMEQSADVANLAGKSVEMISNAIAEMRTYGEGFIIVDQAPGLLDPSAIRNTNTKIIMRLPDQMDRELVGKAANLNEDQITELAKLPCGVAAIYQNEWIQPVLCKVDYFEKKETPYTYEPVQETKQDMSEEARLRIAALLSNGEAVNIEDIQSDLFALHLEASIRVRILKYLQMPPQEPRMTKLAPLMTALFPNVRHAVQQSIESCNDEAEWTRTAERELSAYSTHMEDQTRRDIIQCVMTQCLLIEQNNLQALKDWAERGNMR